MSIYRIEGQAFSKYKSFITGTEDMKDLIIGEHKTHLEQLRDNKSIKPGRPGNPIPHEDAVAIAQQELHAALVVQACLSPGETPASILAGFTQDWDDVSTLLLGRRAAASTTVEGDDDDLAEDLAELMSQDEDWQEVTARPDFGDQVDVGQNVDDAVVKPVAAQVLTKIEERWLARHHLKDLYDDLQKHPLSAPSIEEVDDPGHVRCPEGQENAPSTLTEIVARVSSLPAFNTGFKDDSEEVQLQRILLLGEPIKEFCIKADLSIEFLSRAKILGTHTAADNQWNFMSSQLRLARLNKLYVTGAKHNRAVNWARTQQSLADRANSAQVTSAAPVNLIEQCSIYRPANSEKLQVVAYRPAPDHPLVLGLVDSVYRGALYKKKAGTSSTEAQGEDKTQAGTAPPTRKLKVSKPVPTHLPAAAVKRIHIVPLKTESTHVRYATCFSTMAIIDPVGTVYSQLNMVKFEWDRMKLKVRLDDATLGALLALSEASLEDIPKAVELPLPELTASTSKLAEAFSRRVVGNLRFDVRAFPRTDSGAENIERFMLQLPLHYQQVYGQELLDANGFVRIKTKTGYRKVDWGALAAMVPGYFDIVLYTVAAK
eukprot:TRINITY_DN17132_c0_g1_i4.p1 TRINITY_DN17132_c0_g1~~TRINITY_DN17132_c0_g1_i4.p1  ORF type:complete len:600 (-),score=121.76 TRINITY_DN17132_c0_g1_i4:221-2020(-)